MENIAYKVLLVGILIGALINIRRQNQSISRLPETKLEQLQVSFLDPLTGLPNRCRHKNLPR